MKLRLLYMDQTEVYVDQTDESHFVAFKKKLASKAVPPF